MKKEKPKKPALSPSKFSGKQNFQNSFFESWKELLTTPIHLDSLLSRQEKEYKSDLAMLFHMILQRPMSLCKTLGIKDAQAPWKLSTSELASWKPLREIFQHRNEILSIGFELEDHVMQDFPAAIVKSTSEQTIRELSRPPEIHLRVYQSYVVDEVLSQLKEQLDPEIGIRFSQLSSRAIILNQFAKVLNLDLFKEGAYEIQDVGSQIMSLFSIDPDSVAHLLSDEPGQDLHQTMLRTPLKKFNGTVIDACAGAGGKALALSDAMGAKGRIFAYDISLKKLQALKKRASRAKLYNIQVAQLVPGQEKEAIQKFKQKADLVLVDAPCSGWGVLRRNPDIKWKLAQSKKEDLSHYPELQERLLTLYSEILKPGGRLVYGVCTFRKEETTDIVSRLSAQNSHWKPEVGGYLGPGESDGFFMHSWTLKQ